MISIPLTPDQHAKLMRPLGVTQVGGFQALISRLQAGVRAGGTRLEMERADAERVIRYADSYGEGGYQGLLRTIASDVRAALGEPVASGSLFDA